MSDHEKKLERAAQDLPFPLRPSSPTSPLLSLLPSLSSLSLPRSFLASPSPSPPSPNARWESIAPPSPSLPSATPPSPSPPRAVCVCGECGRVMWVGVAAAHKAVCAGKGRDDEEEEARKLLVVKKLKAEERAAKGGEAVRVTDSSKPHAPNPNKKKHSTLPTKGDGKPGKEGKVGKAGKEGKEGKKERKRKREGDENGLDLAQLRYTPRPLALFRSLPPTPFACVLANLGVDNGRLQPPHDIAATLQTMQEGTAHGSKPSPSLFPSSPHSRVDPGAAAHARAYACAFPLMLRNEQHDVDRGHEFGLGYSKLGKRSKGKNRDYPEKGQGQHANGAAGDSDANGPVREDKANGGQAPLARRSVAHNYQPSAMDPHMLAKVQAEAAKGHHPMQVASQNYNRRPMQHTHLAGHASPHHTPHLLYQGRSPHASPQQPTLASPHAMMQARSAQAQQYQHLLHSGSQVAQSPVYSFGASQTPRPNGDKSLLHASHKQMAALVQARSPYAYPQAHPQGDATAQHMTAQHTVMGHYANRTMPTQMQHPMARQDPATQQRMGMGMVATSSQMGTQADWQAAAAAAAAAGRGVQQMGGAQAMPHLSLSAQSAPGTQ